MGPLAGLKVIEMAGIGPAPFVGMLLSDLGADVIRIDRKPASRRDAFERGQAAEFRRSRPPLDRARPQEARRRRGGARTDRRRRRGHRGLSARRDGAARARPRSLPRRQSRSSSSAASPAGARRAARADRGARHQLYRAERRAARHRRRVEAPLPPLNLDRRFRRRRDAARLRPRSAALWEAERSGRGQVVDAAMTDGAALLMAMIYGFRANGRCGAIGAAANLLDGGAPFYGDLRLRRRQIRRRRRAGAAILRRDRRKARPRRFRARATAGTRSLGRRGARRFAAAFLKKTRDEWAAIFAAIPTPASRRCSSLEEAPAPPPQSRAQDLCGRAGRAGAPAGAALFAHPRRDRRRAAERRRRHFRHPSRARLFRRAHRGAEVGGGDLRRAPCQMLAAVPNAGRRKDRHRCCARRSRSVS